MGRQVFPLVGTPHGSIPGSCCQLSDGVFSPTSKHGRKPLSLGGMEPMKIVGAPDVIFEEPHGKDVLLGVL